MRFVKYFFLILILTLIAAPLQAAQKKKTGITDANIWLFLPIGKYVCYVGSAVGQKNALGLIRPANKISLGARFNPVAVGLSKKELREKDNLNRGAKRAYLECLKKSAADLPGAAPTPTAQPSQPPGTPSPQPTGTPSPAIPEGFSNLLTLEVKNAQSTALLEIGFFDGEWTPGHEGTERTWKLSEPVELKDASGSLLARLHDTEITMTRGAFYSQMFTLIVEAGDLPIEVRATLGAISFPDLPSASAQARVQASFGLSELGGNGGSLTDPEPHGTTGMYSAQYNGAAPNATLLRNLMSTVSCSPGPCNASGSEGPYTLTFSEPVSSLSSQVRFLLSAGDQALANTQYKITGN